MKTRILALCLVAVMMLGVLPVSAMAATKEDTVIQYLGPYVATDLNEDFVAKMLEEKTGFKVQYDQMPSENADQMLMMEVASGTEYDILLTSVNQFNQLAAQNALKPLNDLVEKYPNIREVTLDAGWSLTTNADGQILGIPQGGYGLIYGGVGYRTDLFEQYGWQEPNNIDEFYALCKDIKEKTGLIPLTGSSAWFEHIASGFGLDYAYVVNEDNTVTSYLRDPGMKEYLAFMRKLYEEELIDPDLPVNTGAMVNEKITSGQAVMFVMQSWNRGSWEAALQGAIPEGKMDNFWIALEDAEGKRHINATASVTYVGCIPASCDDETADLVFQMISQRLTPEYHWLINCGIEGTHYQVGANGVATPIQPAFGEQMNYGDKFWIGSNLEQSALTSMCRQAKDPKIWEVFALAQLKSAEFGLNANRLSMANNAAYTQYNAALSTKIGDYMIAVVAGTESLDDYDEFLASWEAEGGLEVEAGLTEWYQANKAFADGIAEMEHPYRNSLDYFK